MNALGGPTARKAASTMHRAVAFSLFSLTLVGSGALLVTFGQSMVRPLSSAVFGGAWLQAPGPRGGLSSGGARTVAQAKFQEHKRVSQAYKLQLEQEKDAAAQQPAPEAAAAGKA